MIMGLGGHWVCWTGHKGVFAIENGSRRVPLMEGCDPAVAYADAALYLANRIKRDRLMLSYARKKGGSINSKKGRKPRITYIDFDAKYLPVAVTLGRCASRRFLDGRPFHKRYKPGK